MGITPLSFTGVSSFSQDFQKIAERAIGIAAFPLKALQQDQAKGLEQSMALGTFRDALAALTASVDELGVLGRTRAVGATVSNSDKLSASAGSDAQRGEYTISNVTSLARPAVSMTVSPLATANSTEVAGAGNYLELWVDGAKTVFNLTDQQDNLNYVRDLINTSNTGVAATVLHADNGYMLSLTATEAGAKTIELWTGADKTGSNLLTALTPGTSAQFDINGQTVTSKSNTISGVIPDVTFTLKGTTSGLETLSISVTTDASQLQGALERFAGHYNNVSEALAAQSGQSKGALNGHWLLSETRERIRAMTGYAGAGDIKSLADLGLTFDIEGKLNFDPNVTRGMNAGRLRAVFEFLGSETTGFGATADGLHRLSDPLIGGFASAQEALKQSDLRMQSRMTEMTARLESMQRDLLQKLQGADVLLARLENQQGLVRASIESLSLVMYGKKQS